ncbi:MAG: peptidoglycan-binding domain-containing protein [Rhizonema sp. PD38]|nr:peptidoglycan-binding domain-containing protein [Rhizonema sp. PD38]
MPVLSPSIKNLVTNAIFTAADLIDLEKSIQSGRATTEDAVVIATRYVDTLEAGVGSWLKKLLHKLDSNVDVVEPIVNLASETALLNGQITLPESGHNSSVRLVQRSLIALASRTQQLDYMLPQYGADGDYGEETTSSVKAFQRKSGLPVTGKVDAKTAQQLDRSLRATNVPGILSATPKDLVHAAQELTKGDVALNYGVPQPWINIDPKHNVPVGKPFEYLINRWKCNLFGGNVLHKGGYEPPYYENQGKGEYPNANQWYKWSDKYAKSNNNHIHFQLIYEIPAATLAEVQRRQKITELLTLVQAGDFVMVDHLGSGIQDGGHTRVAVANNFQTLHTASFAQATYEKSLVQLEGVEQLLNEENIWLLRPNLKM